MEIFETARREPLFFMHIPKTAGTSMRLFLLNQYRRQDVCPAVGWNDLARDGLDLSRYRLVQGHFGYNLRYILPPTMRMLAVFRDPVTRALSALRHLQRDPHFHKDHAAAKSLSLSEIICSSGLLLRQKNVQTAALCANQPPEKVVELLLEAERRNGIAEASELEGDPSLELALNRLQAIDFCRRRRDIRRSDLGYFGDHATAPNPSPSAYQPSTGSSDKARRADCRSLGETVGGERLGYRPVSFCPKSVSSAAIRARNATSPSVRYAQAPIRIL